MIGWYVSHDDELTIDVDCRVDQPAKKLESFRRRLRAAMETGKLDVREVWLFPSSSSRHFHVFIRLAGAMPQAERIVWELRLASDIYGACASMMRALCGVKAASLFLASEQERLAMELRGFYREPDAVCDCSEHTEETLPACPVEKRLRGKCAAMDFFGKVSRGAEEVPQLEVGRIALATILQKEGKEG